MSRTCLDCPKTLGPKNQSGRCWSCCSKAINRDPAIAEARRAALLEHFAKPGVREAAADRIRGYNLNLTTEQRERRRQRGRENVATLHAANRSITREARDAAGRARSDTVLAWCPPEWRDKYRDLKKRGRPAAEAKRIVLDLIAGNPPPILWAQQKRVLAWCPPSRREEYEKLRAAFGAAEARRMIEADMTPFERKLARIAGGARVIDKPVLRRADHDFTLGGIATGML